MKLCMDLHTHTMACGHGYSTLKENIEAAQECGLTFLGLSEHAPAMPGGTHPFFFGNYKCIPREYGDLRLFCGVEANIVDFDGNIDMEEYLLKRVDYVIASMHVACIKPGSIEENTRASIKAMKNPYVKILGHPDDSRYPVDFDVITTVAKETNTLLELNNASLSPNSARQGAKENDLVLLDYCKKKGVPILMGSDAHFFTQIRGHANAEALLKEVDFPEELIMNYFPDKLRKYLNKYILAK